MLYSSGAARRTPFTKRADREYRGDVAREAVGRGLQIRPDGPSGRRTTRCAAGYQQGQEEENAAHVDDKLSAPSSPRSSEVSLITTFDLHPDNETSLKRSKSK